MAYRTIIAVHAWKWVDGPGSDQTYADAEDENVDGWNVHLQHRDEHGDDLLDPDGAPDLDVDVDDYAAAYLIADALAIRNGWELRTY